MRSDQTAPMRGRVVFDTFDSGRVGVLTFRQQKSGVTFVGFPFGGGGAHSFRPLADALPGDWDVVAIEPPGHTRTTGPLERNITALCERYLDALGPLFFERAVLYGHSVGGLIAAAVTQRCEAQGVRPRALVIGATPPPQAIERARRLSAMSEGELFDWWSVMMGTLDAQLDAPTARELFRVYGPAIRADIDVLESATDENIRQITSPTMVLGGERDTLYSRESLRRWPAVLPNITLRTTSGGHLFMLERPEPTAEAIRTFVDGLPD